MKKKILLLLFAGFLNAMFCQSARAGLMFSDDFEGTEGSTVTEAGWIGYALSALPATFYITAEQKYTGSKSVKLTDNNTYVSYLYTVSTVTAGTNYMLSGWFYDNDANTSGYLSISWYAAADGSGSALTSKESSFTTDSGSWQFISTAAVAHASAQSCRVRINIKNSGADTYSIYADSITFVEVLTPPTTHYTLNLTNPANGKIKMTPPDTIYSSASAVDYATATVVNLVAMANSGYEFSSWSGSAVLVSSDTYASTATVTMDANKTIGATFVLTGGPTYYTLTLNSPSNGKVKITPPGTVYSAGTTIDYASSTAVGVVAMANTGYKFSSWSAGVTGAVSDTYASTGTVTMDADKTISATFSAVGSTVAGSPIRINEVAANESNSLDWIEFYVAVGGDYSQYKVKEGTALLPGTTVGANVTSGYTFPDTFNPSAGDYIVLHINNKMNACEDDYSGTGDDSVWDFYTTDSGLTGTDNVILLTDPADTIIDAMAFANNTGSWTGSTPAFNNAVSSGQWTGIASEADSVDSSLATSAGKSLGRDENSTDTDATAAAKDDWSIKTTLTMGVANSTSTVVPPAAGGGSISAIITELATNISNGDFIELFVTAESTDVGGCQLYTGTTLIKTLSSDIGTVSSGTFIVLWASVTNNPSGARGTDRDETSADENGNGYIDLYSDDSSSPGLTSTDNTITLKSAGGTILSFVSIADNDATYAAANKTAYNNAVAANKWSPSASTDAEYVAGSFAWSKSKTNSVYRTRESGVISNTNTKDDWAEGLPSHGQWMDDGEGDGGAVAGPSGTMYAVITEVAPNISGGDFVELFVTAESTNAAGCMIYEGGTKIKTIPSDIGTLPKNMYIVLWASKANNPAGTRGTDRDETAADENGNGYIDLYSDEGTPALTGTDNTISLKTANDTFIDFMSFAENDDTDFSSTLQTVYNNAVTAGQWSPAATIEQEYVDGSVAWSESSSKSMYRISQSAQPLDNHLKADWLEASITPGYGDYGGTPTTTTKPLQIFQSVFSPYGDGKYNQAKISYNVPAGSQITIRVFDIRGRAVRTVVDHVDGGGASETVNWDGKDDNGNVVRTGIYIVNIEAINKSTGAVKRSSKRVVVGRKM
ncbi:MAG: hypothetical protein BWY26_01437 [Elusimicrobia bacterium ADurb.Bin231]|nr:MAG: hypothetical protein BWY26_01437 [Elusimicrobia bacterium ADurb.Bin231]